MSRNGSGTYTLPSGNPVVSGTLIEASWANDTLSDLASAMTDSLSRSAQGGMTAALRLYDGTSSVPGLAWGSETTTGWYRAGAGDMRLVVTGSTVMQYLSTGVAITGTLSASGNTTVGGTLGVTGAATFSSTVAVTGNATVGGTLAITGAVTLTANPTLSAGTANGVPYLNGSKVLTSGSALTFNGTNFATTGSVTSAGSSNSGNLAFTGTSNRITGDFSNATISNRVAFQTSTTNGSTGVVAMPNGTSNTAGFLALPYSAIVGNASSYGQFSCSLSEVKLDSGILPGGGSYLPMTFYTGGSERMRVDTSGNVGIGTSSPSTFSPNTTYANTVAVTKTDQALSFGSYYQAGVDAYSFIKSSQVGSPSTAIDLRFFGGTTERMRIDSSGNLLMATTGEVQFYTSSYGIRASTGLEIKTGDFTRFLQGTTERMRIDSSGNVGIGTSSPDQYGRITSSAGATQVSFMSSGTGTAGYPAFGFSGQVTANGGRGAGMYLAADNTLAFSAAGSERVRIDSSGNLLVGTTSSSARVTIRNATSADGLRLNQEGGTSLYVNNTNASYYAYFVYNGTNTGRIETSGTTTSYVTTSDYRLKENVAPMTDALTKVAALKPVTYTWKNTGEADEGFIAHELAEVCPSAVAGEKDAVDAEGKPIYQGIDTSFLVATLTAAIQELKAINDAQAETITALTARVTALENQP